MERRASEFRQAVAKRNGRGVGRRRFGADLRGQAIAYVRERRQRGGTWAEISEELGVGSSLLQKWLSQEGQFARVEVVEHVAPNSAIPVSLRLVTPGGHEVRGLDVEQTAELLRLLS